MPPRSTKASGSPKKAPRSKKPRPKQPVRNQFRLVLAGLFLVGFLIVSLVMLSTLKESYRRDPEPPVQVLDPSRLTEDVQVELESAILRSGAALAQLEVSRQGTARRLEVAGRFPEAQLLAELSQRLQRLSPDLELLVSAADRRLVVQRGSTLLFTLVFTPESYLPPPADQPRVAIIMDDLGRDLPLARQTLALDFQITMAILPNERYAAEVATLAHRRGREVMIHIPMEPQGYPAANPGEGALFVNLPAEEIQRRFATYLDRIPYAVGGNNHMGSRFTTDRKGMQTVLGMMQREGLFFVDSRTTGGSVALDEARKLGIPATGRDIFLDNEEDVELIVRQIRKLAVLAGKHGTAVAICHPYPETLVALRQELPLLQRSGIRIVPASQLLNR